MATSTIKKGLTRHVVLLPNEVTIAAHEAAVIYDLGSTNSGDNEKIVSVMTNDEHMPNFILFPIFYSGHTYIKAYNVSSVERTVSAGESIRYFTL